MGEVVVLMVTPKEIVTNIGKHKLVLKYDPTRDEEHRWSWTLKIVVTYEYVGQAMTPALCKIAADHYVQMHAQIEDKTSG